MSEIDWRDDPRQHAFSPCCCDANERMRGEKKHCFTCAKPKAEHGKKHLFLAKLEKEGL